MNENDFRKKVGDSFDSQGFMKLINAELVELREGYCAIQVAYHSSLTQQHGFFHAGVVSTLADNAAGYAAFSMMEASSSILTVEFKINLLAPANGEILLAKANVLKKGKTLTICRAEVYNINDGQEKLCAAAQSTLIELRG